jgi:ABC-type polysaccharide/polyol phosphate export permease
LGSGPDVSHSGLATAGDFRVPGYLSAALSDWYLGFARWHLWAALAWNDVRRRYRRSRLGQFWLTLSMAVTITGIGAVYAILFHNPIDQYIPYIAVCFVAWGFISTTVIDSCTGFVENEGIMKYTNVPRSTFVYRLLYRNIIIFAHNVVIVPVVFLYFQVPVTWNILWFAPGAVLVVANCFCAGLVLAIVCARYRDLPQIVASIMQVAFFITPVMFNPAQLAGRGVALLAWNPFANLLEIVRDPLLGEMPSAWAFGYCSATLVLGILAAGLFTAKYSPRVVYWL